MDFAKDLAKKFMDKKKSEPQTQTIKSTIGDQTETVQIPKSKKKLPPDY